jgi:spore photoproduct lyase
VNINPYGDKITMFINTFNQIIVDRNAIEYPMCQKIIKKFPESMIIFQDKPQVNISKSLILTVKKGDMLKDIPYDKDIYPDACALIYQINCTGGCVYCYLQDYYSTSAIIVFVNHDDLLAQIEDNKKGYTMFYAGELNDTLLFDELTEYTRILIPFFANKQELTIELRTKTNNIDNLVKLTPAPNVIVTWSLNPQEYISKYEPNMASLKERLNAAYECQRRGYSIGFHFDPIIYTPDWQEKYDRVIDMIAEVLPEPPKYISSGGFRFTRNLARIINEVHPLYRDIMNEEFVLCNDGKFRYFKPIRIEIYQHIKEKIKTVLGEEVFWYPCMETRGVKRECGFTSNKKLINH